MADVRIAVFCWCCFLLLSIPAAAQVRIAGISGFVSDSLTADPLPGTVVWMYPADTSESPAPLTASVANELGFFTMQGVPPGVYTISGSCVGYHARRTLLHYTGGAMRIALRLLPATIQLGEVTVTAPFDAQAVTGTIELPPALLFKLPALSGEANLLKPLTLLPGVKQQGELSAGLYIRGSSPDENLTLIDGIPTYNPAHLGNFSGTFNASAAQSVKLIKGAFPAEYGGRMGSVLDVKLKSGTREAAKGEFGVGTFSSFVNLEGPLTDAITYLVNGRGMYHHWLQDAVNPASTAPRYQYADGSVKCTGTLAPGDVVTASLSYAGDAVNSPAASNAGTYAMQWSGSTAGITWLHVNANSLFITNTLAFVDYTSRSQITAPGNNGSAPSWFSSSNLTDIMLRTSAEARRGLFTSVKAGSEIILHRYNQIFGSALQPGMEATHRLQPAIIASEAAAYVQLENELFENVFSNAGIRAYYYRAAKYFSAEPRLSVTMRGGVVLLKAAYAETNQFLHLVAPDGISLPAEFWFPSTGSITPSFARQYSGGVEIAPLSGKLNISLEGYYKQLNGIYYSTAAPAGSTTAGLFIEGMQSGKGEAYGMELLVSGNYANTHAWLGYTLSSTRRLFPGLNNGRVFPPRHDRRHDISLAAAMQVTPSLSISAAFVFASGEAITLPDGWYTFSGVIPGSAPEARFSYSAKNQYRLPAYHRLDLNAAWQFTAGGLRNQLTINLYNVYNHANAFAWYPVTSGGGFTALRQLSIFPFIPSLTYSVGW